MEMYYDSNNRMMTGQGLEIVLLLVYETKDGKKYLDGDAIRVLLGKEKTHEYRDKNGLSTIVSSSYLLKKGAPMDSTLVKSYNPDFSDRFTFSEELGLYEVSDTDIKLLIDTFEKLHPMLRVEVKFKELDKKNDINKTNDINNMFNDKQDNSNNKDYNNIIENVDLSEVINIKK